MWTKIERNRCGIRTNPEFKEWSFLELKGEWKIFHGVEYFFPYIHVFYPSPFLGDPDINERVKMRGGKSCRTGKTAPGIFKIQSNKQRR
ncbi:MAG: hypothetical protein H0X47_07570 [Nitrospirales bacterium]|nr:hypothetical protein [Nitrospirales bacterium]